MSQIHPTLETKLQSIARTVSVAMINVGLAIGADAAHPQLEPKPRPEGFTTTPAPSSLLLIIVGFAALLGWHWWRTRQVSRD
jgi:hypothetical protein